MSEFDPTNPLNEPDDPLNQPFAEEDEHSGELPKKSSSMMPVIGLGIVVLGMVVFFGWRILAPHFSSREAQADQMLSAESERKPQASVPPVQSQTAQDITSSQSQPQAMPEVLTLQSQTPARPDLGGVATVQNETSPGPAVAAIAPQQMPQQQNQPGVTSDDLGKVNARIDSLERVVLGLKEQLEKLDGALANAAAHRVVQKDVAPKKVHAKEKDRNAKTKANLNKAGVQDQDPKPVEKKADVTPVTKDKVEKGPSPSPVGNGNGMHLKAVLDGRAYFQSKDGTTYTVAAGEELKGVGVVKKIDAERGVVTFTNDVTMR